MTYNHTGWSWSQAGFSPSRDTECEADPKVQAYGQGTKVNKTLPKGRQDSVQRFKCGSYNGLKNFISLWEQVGWGKGE